MELNCNLPENKNHQACLKSDIKPIEKFECKIDKERKKMICEFDLDILTKSS